MERSAMPFRAALPPQHGPRHPAALANTHAEPTPPHQQALDAALTDVEARIRIDGPAVYEEAVAVQETASRIGDERQRMRAQLTMADVMSRRGHVTAGGKLAEDIRDWAREHHDSYIHARSHRVLGGYYYRLGDEILGMQSAVACLQLLPDDAPARIKIDHRLCVADALAMSGSAEAAFVEYREAIAAARTMEEPDWLLVCLNNYAVTMYERDSYEEAASVIDEMLSLWDHPSLARDYCYLETLARLQLGLGNVDDAVALLEPVVTAGIEASQPDPYGFTDCLLTWIDVRLNQGDVVGARRAIDLVEELQRRDSAVAPLVTTLSAQGRVCAAEGDYERAYCLQVQANEALVSSRADERDAQSRLVHAVHASAQARADSDRFRQLSLVDPMTSAGNRRFMNDVLPTRLALAHERPIAVAVLDIDHFKIVNDTFSHMVGDFVLQEIAAMIAQVVGIPATEQNTTGAPDADCSRWAIDVLAAASRDDVPLLARLGGEEFLVAFPAHTVGEARETAERLRERVRREPWLTHPHLSHITISVGVVFVSTSATLDAVLGEADRRLYAAKKQGRDRVVSADQTAP